MVRRLVHRNARLRGLWQQHWLLALEPGGTNGHDVGAADEEGDNSLTSVLAVRFCKGLHPGCQPNERRVGPENRGIGYARDDRARFLAEPGLGEAGNHGGTGRDVVEDSGDERGVVDVFEEGAVGVARGGRCDVDKGGLQEGPHGFDHGDYFRCVGAAALDGVRATRHNICGRWEPSGTWKSGEEFIMYFSSTRLMGWRCRRRQ